MIRLDDRLCDSGEGLIAILFVYYVLVMLDLFLDCLILVKGNIMEYNVVELSVDLFSILVEIYITDAIVGEDSIADGNGAFNLG